MFAHVHTTKLIQEESNEQVCRVFFPLSPFPHSSTQSEETMPLQPSYVDFYAPHITTFPFHQTDMATTVFVLFYDNCRQVETKISQQIQVKKRSALLEFIYIYPIYLHIIPHIGIKPTDFIVLAEAQRTCTCQSKYGTFCELLKKIK